MPLPLVHALSRVLQLPCPLSEAASFFRLRAFSAVRFKRLACCVLCGRLSQPMSPWSGVRVLTVQSGLSLRRTALSLPHLKSPLSSLREPPPSLRDLGKPQLGSWGVWWKRTVTNTWTISLKLSFSPFVYVCTAAVDCLEWGQLMTERATSMLVKARATRVHETVRAGDEARTLPQLPVSTLSPVFLVTWQSYFQSPVVRPVPGAKQQNESWGRRRLNTRDNQEVPPSLTLRILLPRFKWELDAISWLSPGADQCWCPCTHHGYNVTCHYSFPFHSCYLLFTIFKQLSRFHSCK